MTLVGVQCRISSTRLPGKAVLDLGGKTVLDWCLASMRKVQADEYYVATDAESEPSLKEIAERNGFKVFVGSLNDVLDRYCSLISHVKADIVVRATADNPFLFYEAAQALLELYVQKKEAENIDYITWKGLPHGSGIEIFSARSLLKARTLTDMPYDHEHVGPSLYNHPENFKSLFVPAPQQWNYPELRTTIDTDFDYRRAQKTVNFISHGTRVNEPYTCEQIVNAFKNDFISKPVLFIPSVVRGHGTGHLRRCISAALQTGGDIYIDRNATLDSGNVLDSAFASGLNKWQVTDRLPQKGEYALIVTDCFKTEGELLKQLSALSNVVSIDDGGENVNCADYLLDIIPGIQDNPSVNLRDYSFIDLPSNRKTSERPSSFEGIKNVLVCLGGEDPEGLALPAAKALAVLHKNVTAVVKDPASSEVLLTDEEKKYVYLTKCIPDLKEKLYGYDLVVTHFGLTAFEAAAAGCALLLLGTTPLHLELARKYGFASLDKGDINDSSVLRACSDVNALYPALKGITGGQGRQLGSYITALSKGRRFACPVCRSYESVPEDPVESRVPSRTFRRCRKCSMLYMAWTSDEENTDYNESYFFDDYKKQYGRTYLEDFDSIKAQCLRRMGEIKTVYDRVKPAGEYRPSLLDVGCAFGPCLAAASQEGWNVFGTDISEEAVSYVRNTLNFPAANAAFPDIDTIKEFSRDKFDALTMWYVIEHFQDLDSVLKAVSRHLNKGGIFAFSTPSAGGVSARYNPEGFFTYSPKDHYTLWEPKRAAAVLKRYGFKLCKTVITGHHPERFPGMNDVSRSSLKFSVYSAVSRLFGLGDTFEVYCVKEKDLF
ncbi:MAG: methyltransferase domain-containing protein [Treponema sp.]|nr:methyltransferase domain-containing protein [Treponema sp.]